MRAYLLSMFFGLTATIALGTSLPVQAQAKIYQKKSGTASFNLNAETLNILNSLGLSLASVESTATPYPGFTYGWKLIPSSVNNEEGTNLKFSYDAQTGEFMALPSGIGTIEGIENYETTLVFNVDKTKLILSPEFVIQGISLTLATDRDFLSSNGVINGSPLLDLAVLAPPVVDVDHKILKFDDLRTYLSPEFSDFLVAAGATKQVTGLEFFDSKSVYSITEVPEPNSVLPILIIGIGLIASRHKF
ncbi:PEP-CTERM sorting domain-containing protein [Nostoc sp.]|uniref:PEP-CTERM sorting domain-containing protein n=1 Tax=Nostoc sp. TaxID=1180 RepID=UPI002FFA0B68